VLWQPESRSLMASSFLRSFVSILPVLAPAAVVINGGRVGAPTHDGWRIGKPQANPGAGARSSLLGEHGNRAVLALISMRISCELSLPFPNPRSSIDQTARLQAGGGNLSRAMARLRASASAPRYDTNQQETNRPELILLSIRAEAS
jgi:hypothetical protein